MTVTYQCYPEIISQQSAWQQAVDEVNGKVRAIHQFFAKNQPTDILFTGCGSPFYLGETIRLYWQAQTGVRCSVVPASELVQYSSSYLPPKDSSPLLVVISRSGATTEAIWAADAFSEQHPERTMLISCAPGSPLDDRASLSILMPAGHEQTVPQTRSFAAMYLAAQMTGALIGGDDEMVSLLRKAPTDAGRIIAQWEGVAAEIGQQNDISHVFYMGAGPLYGVAREGALKMTEMSVTTCSAYQFMEARHGPRSIIDEHTLVTGLFGHAAPGHEARVVADIISTSNPVSVALTPTADWNTGGARHHIPVGVDWPDSVQGLAYLPILHLMAYYRAVARGVNPDTSRHLSIYVDLNEA